MKHDCPKCGKQMKQIGKPQYMRVGSFYRCNECQINENSTLYNEDNELLRDDCGRIQPLLNEER